MQRRIGAKRKLRAESLESRQLLHGGAMAGGEPATAEERVESAFQRYDVNEDSELAQDEVSSRLWDRISAADGEDDNTTVSVEELTSHLESRIADRADRADRAENAEQSERNDRGRRRGRGERLTAEERVDAFFAENDTNVDGVITDADEVSEELLAEIADADLDGDGVSADDLLARIEARQAENAQARFDARFARLDDDGDGSVTEEEAGRRWERIAEADADDSGSVSSQELQTYLEAQRAEREADMTNEDNVETNEDVGGELVTEAGSQNVGGRRGRGGGRGRR